MTVLTQSLGIWSVDQNIHKLHIFGAFLTILGIVFVYCTPSDISSDEVRKRSTNIEIALYVILSIISGVCLSIKHILCKTLCKELSGTMMRAELITLISSMVFLIVPLLISLAWTPVQYHPNGWWIWSGAFLSTLFSAAIAYIPQQLESLFTINSISGQLFICMILDNLGAFDTETISIKWNMIIGTIIMIMGIVMIKA